MQPRSSMPASLRRPFQTRTFSTTPSLAGRKPKTNILAILSKDAPSPPPYPYAPRHHWYKQAQRGLYGGSQLQHGNNVSKQNEIKTRRTFYPNVQTKRVFSRALNRWLYMRLTTRVLRTLDRVGGVDNYVIGQTAARLKSLGLMGWHLRWVVLHTPWARETLGEATWKRLVEGVGEGKMDYEALTAAEALQIASGEGVDNVAEDDVVVDLGDLQEDDVQSVPRETMQFMDEQPQPPRSKLTNLS